MENGFYIAVIVIIVALAGIFVSQFASSTASTAAVVAKGTGLDGSQANQQAPSIQQPAGGVVAVKLGFDGSQYSPADIQVKQGDKVRIEGDTNTLRGCMTMVTIPDYGIRKRILQGDNIIEFTADKPGVFRISCPMGMGNGRLIVADSSGNLPAEASAPRAPPSAAGSCGGSGGGCGCGG